MAESSVGDIQSLGPSSDYDSLKKSSEIIIITIIVSGLIFTVILEWFNFLQLLYLNLFTVNGSSRNMNSVANRIGFTIFITVLIVVLIYGIYKLSLKLKF